MIQGDRGRWPGAKGQAGATSQPSRWESGPMSVDLGHAIATEANGLPEAAEYFPLTQGRYEVKPGMLPLGTNFGNGEADQKVFQIDKYFFHYRQMKELARQEDLSKYYQTYQYSSAVAIAIAEFIIKRLIQEYPQHIQLTKTSNGSIQLKNDLTQETLYFDRDYCLQRVEPRIDSNSTPYVSTLDALAMQVQEDLVVLSRRDLQHWMSAIHLCFPNHWAAATKIGQDFATVHGPVAGMAAMNRRGAAIAQTMITRSPTVRFAWGLSTDCRLNHHPVPPPGIDVAQWQGRQFNPAQPRLFLRVERQVIWGLPAVDAALFTIRTYFQDCEAIKPDPHRRSRLVAAIESMSPEALAYKGLSQTKAAILQWLQA